MFTLFSVLSRANMFTLCMVPSRANMSYAVLCYFFLKRICLRSLWYFHERICLLCFLFFFFFLKRMCLRWVICSFLLANMLQLFMATL